MVRPPSGNCASGAGGPDGLGAGVGAALGVAGPAVTGGAGADARSLAEPLVQPVAARATATAIVAMRRYAGPVIPGRLRPAGNHRSASAVRGRGPAPTKVNTTLQESGCHQRRRHRLLKSCVD